MSNTIGRFEILSELAKSDSGSVYKASDHESGQTLALKVMRLDVFGEYADEVVQRILQEADSTKDLSSPNITLVYGAGEIDGQFCAAMEYVQGNSIATMLARKEGFSIWDLLDISRQVCQGLDHAHQNNVFHYSLEPAKVMVTWDGTVKILSFGISSAGYVAAQAEGFPPPVLHYMSPEQVSGETLDARSNLFTWGAMLYEMVTDRKAFPGEDAESVRHKILEEDPVAPAKVNPKINPIASEVIMKALAKDPAQRFASGPEMAAAMEGCREVAGKGAKKAEAPKGTVAVDKARAATAAAKFAASPKAPVAPTPQPAAPPAELEVHAAAPSLADELETSWVPPTQNSRVKPEVAASPVEFEAPTQKAAAAAASWSGGSSRLPSIDPSAQFMKAKSSMEAGIEAEPTLSAPVLDEPEVEKPRIAVDPLMAEDAGSAQKTSFSDLEELPPLKEVYIAPPPTKSEAPEPEAPLPSIIMRSAAPEKPKVDPREVAEKAIKEIKGVPPKLMVYSLSGAVAVVLIIAGTVAWRSYSQSTDEEGKVPRHSAAAAQAPAPTPEPAEVTPVAPEQPAAAEPATQEVAAAPAAPKTASAPVKGKKEKGKKGAVTAQGPVVSTGDLSVESSPEGAQLQIDGRADASWITPFSLSGLTPGPHTVVVSKSGFGQESHTVEVTAGSKASLAVHLVALNATMSVSSEPAGANIFVDGKDSGKVTPAQVTIDKGTHTILVRKAGYLDETTSASGAAGQNFHFAPTLRALGNADDIKTVGKLKKFFGGNSAQTGMGKVSVRTTPKGAQIAVNRRMLDKGSPAEFLLNPGNYIIDITQTGYKPVQKVITVEKDGAVTIDETLQPQ